MNWRLEVAGRPSMAILPQLRIEGCFVRLPANKALPLQSFALK
jgi:hypothetical protein